MVSFLVDGEFKSWQESAATAFGFPRRDCLNMRRRPPGLSVGLAASLRSMPTALTWAFEVPVHRNGLKQLMEIFLI
jgi:hypothetical protein